MTRTPQDWIILRCKGANTLSLAASLGATGYDVWTPTEMPRKREGEGRSRSKAIIPVMPTYVFAQAAHLPELLMVSEAPTSPHPDFSVFRYHRRIPLIADVALDPLRVAERMGTPLEKAAILRAGDAVRYPEAGFQGLSGQIVETKRNGKFALVAFGVLRVEIASMLLLPDKQQPHAKAA